MKRVSLWSKVNNSIEFLGLYPDRNCDEVLFYPNYIKFYNKKDRLEQRLECSPRR